MKKMDVVLVGFEPRGSENLALRVIAQAALDAGLDADVMPLASIEEAPRVLERAIERAPLALGFTLQDSVSAIRTLPLTNLARRRGYSGFIVCGGPFATLQTNWVLEHAPAVDGVVRHAGETPVVELIDALRHGRNSLTVPGLVTRDGGNCLHTAASAQPSAWRPLRGARPEILGIPTAEVIASLGCRERCDYCTHAAVASLAMRELGDAGVSPEELRRSGLGRTVRRPVTDLADELAQLYHDSGVRYFQVIDENPIPEQESAALAWIDELRSALQRRRVGTAAFSFLTRGAALTAPIIDALVELGLVRTLIGIESGTALGLRSLGRRGNAGAGLAALRHLDERGVLSMFNSLMIHPDSTLDSVRIELEFLSSVGHAMFETVEAAPFTGTQLHARMGQEGRLFGGSLLPMFDSGDPALERFRVLRSRLRFEALGSYTPTFRAHDVWLSAAILARCGKSSDAQTIASEVRTLVAEINASRLAVLHELVQAAQTGHGGSSIIELARQRFSSQQSRLLQLADRLRCLGQPGGSLSRHCRNFAAAASLVFALASAPACHRVSSDEEADSGADSLTGNPDTSPRDTGTSTGSASEDWGTDFSTDSDSDSQPCEPAEMEQLQRLLEENCRQEEEQEVEVKISIGPDGSVQSVEIMTQEEQETGQEPSWVREMEDCYLELLEEESFPCLSGQDVSFWIRDWGTPV